MFAGKVLTFINIFCEIFDSLKPDNMELPAVKVVESIGFHAGTVLLNSNNTLHLFSVSFDGRGLNILKTNGYVAWNFLKFSVISFI